MEGEEANRLFRVYKTTLKMLTDRGYFVPDSYTDLTFEDFVAKIPENKSREPLTMLFHREDDESKKIYVFFPEEKSITVPAIANYAQRMHRDAVQRAILVAKGNITSSAKQGIQELQPHFYLEYFDERELQVNITEHELVPQHIVLTDNEKQALMKRYRVKETQLPKIQVTDPVARYYGLNKGQVVKIIRASETAGRYITYRLAV